MPTTALDLSALDVTALGEAAAAALPAAIGWSVAADDSAPLPGPEAVAVAVELGGGDRMAVVVAKPLGRQVQVGPPPAEDLVDGLTAAVDAAVALLGSVTGQPVTRGEVVEVDASGALRPEPGQACFAAVLADGDEHVATVGVLWTPPAPVVDAAPHELAPILQGETRPGAPTGLELLHEVEMGVTVELGRTRMLVRDVLGLSPGSVVELDRSAGSPVDVLVNGTLIARGEVVVIDEEFGVRITEVISS